MEDGAEIYLELGHTVEHLAFSLDKAMLEHGDQIGMTSFPLKINEEERVLVLFTEKYFSELIDLIRKNSKFLEQIPMTKPLH